MFVAYTTNENLVELLIRKKLFAATKTGNIHKIQRCYTVKHIATCLKPVV